MINRICNLSVVKPHYNLFALHICFCIYDALSRGEEAHRVLVQDRLDTRTKTGGNVGHSSRVKKQRGLVFAKDVYPGVKYPDTVWHGPIHPRSDAEVSLGISQPREERELSSKQCRHYIRRAEASREAEGGRGSGQ